MESSRMNNEAQMWKDRYFALKEWVEINMNKEFEHPWWTESTKNMSEEDKNRAYNMREIEYYNKRALLDAVTVQKAHTSRAGKDMDLL